MSLKAELITSFNAADGILRSQYRMERLNIELIRSEATREGGDSDIFTISLRRLTSVRADLSRGRRREASLNSLNARECSPESAWERACVI